MKLNTTIILGALCSLLLASCSPLTIAINKQTPDGVRTVCTSAVDLFRYKDGSIGLGMGVRLAGKDTIAALVVRCDAKTNHGIFDKGNRMLFRLNDDSEIILTNVLDKEYDEDVQTHVTEEYRHAYGYSYCYSPWGHGYYVAPYEIGAMVPTVRVEDNSASYALYLVSREQLISIVTKGVKKFRVECESSDLDMPYPDSLGQTIIQLFTCLRDGVKNDVVRKKF